MIRRDFLKSVAAALGLATFPVLASKASEVPAVTGPTINEVRKWTKTITIAHNEKNVI